MSGRPLRTETAAIFCLRSTSRSYEHVRRSTGYLGSLGAATRIRAVLRRTQLECDFGGSRVLIGTQEVAEPVYSGLCGHRRSFGGTRDSSRPARCPSGPSDSTSRTLAWTGVAARSSGTRPTATRRAARLTADDEDYETAAAPTLTENMGPTGARIAWRGVPIR